MALRKLKGLVADKADPDPNKELWDLVENTPVPEWTKTATTCTHCNEALSAHHNHNCRICGSQFCSQCTGKFHLPAQFQLKPTKKDESAQRVCYGCRDTLSAHGTKNNIQPIPSRIFVPVWELRADAPECHKCHRKFKSSHHNCRACGKSFCSDCSSKRVLPPAFLKKGKTGPTRVCDFCRYAIVKGAVLDEDQAKARLVEGGKAADSEVKIDLRQVLDVPQYLAKLREYCSLNHARENLNFIDAVEVFEDAVSTTQAALFPLANTIYHEFLVQTANQLVNLTSAEFDEIEDRMATGSVDSKLFRRAYDNVFKMVSKDVFRRFSHTEEAKMIIGGQDKDTLSEYFLERHTRLSFSIVQRLEDLELMQTLETELRQVPKLFHTIRQGLKSWPDAVEGSALVTHLCKVGRAKTRAEGMSVAARMVEAGYLHHAIDPTLSFYDSENSTNIYQLPQQSDAKKFPSASTLLQNPQNVSSFFLLRGMRYNRLWGICSVKECQIYFWRQDKHPHFVLPLKGVTLVLETGGEIDEGDGDGHAFGVRSEKKEEQAKSLRHGQVYLRVTMPASAERLAEANETLEYVFLLEDSSMRTRWRKCLKECGLETTMITHTGVSKRAAITGQVAKRGVVNERAEINNQTAAMAEKVKATSPTSAGHPANPPPPALTTPPPPALTTPPPPALTTPPPPALTTPPPPAFAAPRPPALSTPPPPTFTTPPPPAVSSPRGPALSVTIPSHSGATAPRTSPPPAEPEQYMMQQKERQAAFLGQTLEESNSPPADAKMAIPVRPTKKTSTKPGMGHSNSALSLPHRH